MGKTLVPHLSCLQAVEFRQQCFNTNNVQLPHSTINTANASTMHQAVLTTTPIDHTVLLQIITGKEKEISLSGD
jgi:hypothetical protein